MSNATEKPLCNCSYIDGIDCAFDADPDIAGIGVLISFVVSVSLTYCILLYTFYVMPEAFSAGMLNRLDLIVIKRVRQTCSFLIYPAIYLGFRKPDWSMDQKDLKVIVMMLNDQQLITGLAIMTVAYVQIQTITTYHFYMVSNLAELAFVAHWGTANLLRDELMEHPVKKHWRILALLIFIVVLLVSQIPTGHNWWLYTLGISTVCVWNAMAGNYHGSSVGWMVFRMLIISWGITSVLYRFYDLRAIDRVVETLNNCIAKMVLALQSLYFFASERAAQASRTHIRLFWNLLKRLSYVAAVFVFIIGEVIYSETFDLLRTWAFLLNNTTLIFWLRSVGGISGMVGDENSWGFGQAVPVFLLLLPFASIAETLYENITKSTGQVKTVDAAPRTNMIFDEEHRHTEEPISVDADRDESATSRSSARSTSSGINQPKSRTSRSIHTIALDEESRGSIIMSSVDSATGHGHISSECSRHRDASFSTTAGLACATRDSDHASLESKTDLDLGVYDWPFIDWIVLGMVVGLYGVLTWAGCTNQSWLV